MAFGGDIQLDDSLWPLLLVRFVGVPSVSQLESYLEWMAKRLEQGQPYVSILDSTRMTGLVPAQQRQLQAAWMRKHDTRLRELDRGTAFIIPSPVMRLALSALFHLKPMPSPYIVTGTLREGAVWTVARLEEEGQVSAARRVREHFGLSSEGNRA
jgi:hypothetical protein